MITHYPTQKLCATCEYWTGSRELNGTKTQLKADDKGSYKCIETKNPVKKANHSCSKWKKWTAFK